MLCIFCGKESSGSRSSEHIIPESLWNRKHVLPPGVVCDGCNNYFAVEVEKPFLESPAIRRLRFQQVIPNKRGKVPAIKGLMLPGFEIELIRSRNPDDPMHLVLTDEAWKAIGSRMSGTLLLQPNSEMPDDRVTSRFLAKMAIEAMAYQLLSYPAGIEYIATEEQLNPLRRYARRGEPKKWPHHERQLYHPDKTSRGSDGLHTQVVHEFDFLITDGNEWYFVFCLFGREFAINLGGPEVDGYELWLEKNNGESPLYVGKNASHEPKR